MESSVSPERAKIILEMLTSGGAMNDINTPLALRLIPLSMELGDIELAEKLLDHAANVAENEVESGWTKFESLKYIDAGVDTFYQLAVESEQMSEGQRLAAAVLHHVSLLQIASDDLEDAKVSASRALRIREDNEDSVGIVYGIAVLEAIAKKQQDVDTAIALGTRRVEILMRDNDEDGQVEAMSDLAHSQATVGHFDSARDLYTESLEIAKRLENLSGQLVAYWGLADLCEINEDYESAMLHLSDCLHAFLEQNLPAPSQVRIRINALADIQDNPAKDNK
jgi:tetratricopeptide (TPR) repeat protein